VESMRLDCVVNAKNPEIPRQANDSQLTGFFRIFDRINRIYRISIHS
jgi:hypothetical protein